MGTLVQARKEQGFSIEPTFSVSVIFGKRDEVSLFYWLSIEMIETF